MNSVKRLSPKNTALRRELASCVRVARSGDRKYYGLQSRAYRLDRKFGEVHFDERAAESIRERLSRGEGGVRVLDKGCGTGNFLAHVKRICPQKVHTTGMSLTGSLAGENKPLVDEFVREIGLTTRHAEGFDVIRDAYGEDYHLPARFLWTSLRNTVSNLKPGGEAFIMLRTVARPGCGSATLHQCHGIVTRLKQLPQIEVMAVNEVKWPQPAARRVPQTNVDILLHFRKKTSRTK